MAITQSSDSNTSKQPDRAKDVGQEETLRCWTQTHFVFRLIRGKLFFSFFALKFSIYSLILALKTTD